MYVLHKNGVITGHVNAFCLVCDCLLANNHDAKSHIKGTLHCTNLSQVPYSDKFEDHHIRKFKTGYFCEFCNVLFLTAVKVNLHIEEEDHMQRRGTYSLRTSGDGVIVFKNVLIKDHVWHGLLDNVCCICDIEYDDEDDHKKETTHILNLIQKPVKFGGNNDIYRQIDRSSIQCLTCNLLLSSNTIISHFDDTDHINLYSKCKIDINSNGDSKYEVVEQKKEKDIHISTEKCKDMKDETPNKDDNISKILASMTMYQSKNIDINLETETAFCRTCWEEVQFDQENIDEHIQLHSQLNVPLVVRYPSDVGKTMYSPNPGQINENNNNADNDSETGNVKTLLQIQNSNNDADAKRDINNDNKNKNNDADGASAVNNEEIDAISLAEKHNITYNATNNKAFCRVCQVKLPSSLKSLVEHVKGLAHNKKLKSSLQKSESSLKKKDMITFVYSVRCFKHIPIMNCIVNGEYCISQLSFYFIEDIPQTNGKHTLYCLLCERNIARDIILPIYKAEVELHVKVDPHDSVMETLPVITSLKGEFVREIRPGSFHCGYCNLVVTSWDKMEDHLNSTDHIDTKAVQLARLQRERAAMFVRTTNGFGLLIRDLFN